MSEQLIPVPGTFGNNDDFLVERELGQGGMGGVYMGKDKMLDRPVAIKVMLKEYGADAEFVEKFKKEAQAAAKLMHPNIAQIYSFGICNEMPYIVMELVSGGSLYSVMQASDNGKTSDITRVMKIGQQVARALQCASDQGFVHGDVKPENILLDANGNAKLVDFGLAAMQKDTEEIWGTPYYIAPEKVRKEPVDFRADMYSLGGTLYHALTGTAPFEGEDSIAVVKKRFESTPDKPSTLRPEITPAIDKLVMKMLAFNPADRYPSFEALLTDFESVLSKGLTRKIETGKRIIMKRTTRPIDPVDDKSATPPPAVNDGDSQQVDPEVEKPDEEEGGNLGLKVVLFIVGGLLVIAAVVGGLFWFMNSSKAKEESERVRQIQSGIDKASAAITETLNKAGAFASDFDKVVSDSLIEVEKIEEELGKYLSGDEFEKAMTDIRKRSEAAKTCIEDVKASNQAIIDKSAEADSLKSSITEENMGKLADLSNSLVEMYDRMKGAENVLEVRKGINLIKDSGKRMIESAKKNQNVERLKAERQAKKDAEEAKEKARKEKAELDRKAKVAEEVAAITAKFASFADQGLLRQLDWEGAERQIKALAAEFTTAEGELAAKNQLKKIACLKRMHTTLVENMEGYTFKKDKLKGFKVVNADEKTGLSLINNAGKKQTISWAKFFKAEYYASLREAFGYFIFNGRKNAKLSKMAWAEAMSGAAMTMKTLHNDEAGSMKLLEETLKKFPDFRGIAADLFPGVTLPEISEDDEEE